MTLSLAASGGLMGCNHAQFEAARAQRRGHVERIGGVVRERESRRVESLYDVADLHESRNELRGDRAEFPCDVMEQRRDRRKVEGPRRTSKFLDLFRRGDTSRIPDRFGRMFY